MQEKDYDIIIVGAGASGVAAALQASEHAARTLLVDDGPGPGGDIALGLLNHWTGDSASAAMESIKAFSKRAWGRSILEPEDLSAHFSDLLAHAKVDTLYRARAIKRKGKSGKIKSITFSTAQGREKLSAWCYIDATPDSAMASLCGCAADHSREPSMTVIARIGGIDTRVPGVFDAEALRQYTERFRYEQAYEELPQEVCFPRLTPCPRGGTAMLDASAVGVRPIGTAFEAAAAEATCRANALAAIGFLKRNVPGYENCYLIHFAHRWLLVDRPRILRSRSFAAVSAGAAIEDAVILQLKEAAAGVLQPVPFGNLLCPEMDNLLMAEASDIASGCLSAQLQCGGAAGRAAALSLLYDGSLRKIEPERFRRAMAQEHGSFEEE